MRIFRIILSIVSVFALFSCEKENTPGGQSAPKDGRVSIAFNAGRPASKATEEEIAAALADGSMFSDLWLWLVRKEGTAEDVRRFVHFTFDATTERVVEFDAVERGDYILYAVANFTNDRGIFTDYAPVGYKVNDDTYLIDDIPDAAKRQLDDNFTKLTLAPLEEGVPPTVHKNGGKMPISLVAEFSVGAGINRVAAELTRVCGRISVVIRNLSSEYSIAINELELSRLNPNIGYLFSHDHSVPGGTDFFRDFIPFTKKEGRDYALIGPGTESTVFSQMLYETGEDISLGLSLAGAMLVDADMNGIPEDKYTFSSLPQTAVVYSMGKASAPSSGSRYVVVPESNLSAALSRDGSNAALRSLSWYDENKRLLNYNGIDDYLWTYSSGNPTLKNAGNSRNLAISSSRVSLTTGTSNTSLTVEQRVSGYNIYTSSSSWWGGTSYYFLGASGGSIGPTSSSSSTNNNNYCIWQFYLVEPEEVITGYEYATNGNLISYSTDAVQIIGSTGTAVPLTRICRIQDLMIVWNISFNPYIGEFEYVILPWNGREVPGIEFN